MPTLIPGTTHIAHVKFTYPAAGLPGKVHLFLATADANHNPVNMLVDMAEVSFSFTGVSQTVDVPNVTIPPAAAGQTITAFAEVKSGGVVVYPLYSTDTINVPGSGSGGAITWD